jgi:hypothetical protein
LDGTIDTVGRPAGVFDLSSAPGPNVMMSSCVRVRFMSKRGVVGVPIRIRFQVGETLALVTIMNLFRNVVESDAVAPEVGPRGGPLSSSAFLDER